MAAGQSDFIAELAEDISREANGEKSTRALKADLNTLSEQIVDVVFHRRTDAIANAYEHIERSYSDIVTLNGIDETKLDAAAVAAELRALTRLLGAAVQYKSPAAALSVVRESNYRPLLLALRNLPNGLSTSDLAKKLKYDASTVARKLPYLRSVDLVRSQQVGRTMMNRLTSTCESLLQEDEAMVAPNAQWSQIDAGVMCIAHTAMLLGNRLKVNPQLTHRGVKQVELKFVIKLEFSGAESAPALEWPENDISHHFTAVDAIIPTNTDHVWAGFLDNKEDLRMGQMVLRSNEGFTFQVDAQERKVFASLETAIFNTGLQTSILNSPDTATTNKPTEASYLYHAAKKRGHR